MDLVRRDGPRLRELLAVRIAFSSSHLIRYARDEERAFDERVADRRTVARFVLLPGLTTHHYFHAKVTAAAENHYWSVRVRCARQLIHRAVPQPGIHSKEADRSKKSDLDENPCEKPVLTLRHRRECYPSVARPPSQRQTHIHEKRNDLIIGNDKTSLLVT